ncbi:MAG TPA: FAD-dependent oxidoreductase [Eoetvoesiella sp.]
MSATEPVYDAIIIGGGFYGAAIAVYLARQRGFKRVLLVEQEDALLQRASYSNQARIHNGYHYPRSFTTAYRSRVNLPKFVRDWPEATKQDFTKLYAIARRNSKVTSKQFERFCSDIGARIRSPESGLRALFEPRLIEGIYLVDEYAFDTTKLAGWARRELQEASVELRFATRVDSILTGSDNGLRVQMKDKNGYNLTQTCRYLFNCT